MISIGQVKLPQLAVVKLETGHSKSYWVFIVLWGQDNLASDILLEPQTSQVETFYGLSQVYYCYFFVLFGSFLY